MDNLVLLSKQFLKPVKAALIVADSMWVLVIAFTVLTGDHNDLFEMGLLFGGPIIVLLVLNLLFLEAVKPERFLGKWPPDTLISINEECMTGYRCGNGILCENGCLLIVGMTIKAFLPQYITMIHKQDIQGGLIFVTDKWGHQHAVRASSRAVKGKVTFREVDVDTFWEKLSSAKEKAGTENQ